MSAVASSLPGSSIVAPRNHGLRLVVTGAEVGSAALRVVSIEPVPLHGGADEFGRGPLPIACPGFVNAHTHLDLTHVGPRAFPEGATFADWAGEVIRARHEIDARASTEEGVRRSLAGGVVAVGDIAGDHNTVPSEVVLGSALGGVSFLELFGIGDGEESALNELDGRTAKLASLAQRFAGSGGGGAGLSYSPHAPYSASPALIEMSGGAASATAALRPVLAFHLAETVEERELIARGTGPFRELLERLGGWGERAEELFGSEATPVGFAAPCLRRVPTVLGHVNDASDADIEVLAELSAGWRAVAEENGSGAVGGVAFCARGHRYFRHHEDIGPHRFGEMLEAGVNVCLGTDSVINLPEEESGEITPLDDARLLASAGSPHGRVACSTLLEMITVNPARALGLDAERFTLRLPTPGMPLVTAGVNIVGLPVETARAGDGRNPAADPVEALMTSGGRPTLLWDGSSWHPDAEAL